MTGFWDYVRALRARWYVVLPAALVGALVGLVTAQIQPKQYRATARVLVESNRPRMIGSDADGRMHASTHAELQTQALLVQSQAVATRVILRLHLEREGPFTESDDVPAALLGSLSAKPIRDTRFLEVSCETTSPKWAALIANTAADCYIAENLDRREKYLSEVHGLYSLRYPELDAKLQKVEEELTSFQQEYLVVSSEAPEATLRQRELKLLEQLSDAQRERITFQARLKQLGQTDEQRENDPSLARAIAAEDPWVRQLLEERLNQASRIVELRQSFSDGHRDLESAKARMEKIEKELASAIRGFCSHAQRAFQASEWKEKEIQRILDEHRQEIARLRKVLARYGALSQRRDSLARLLNPLADDQAKVDLAKGIEMASATVVDSAQKPKSASRPIRTNYIIIGFVLGLLAGVRLALALEAANEAVHTTDDIARMVAMRSVGTVSRIDRQVAGSVRSRALAIANLPNSMASEQFRSLRTGIIARAPWKGTDHGGVVLVTSASLGEGKSLIAANTAEAFAQLGKPVLLIDADLRRSAVHAIFDLPREQGLSDVLEGDLDPLAAVKVTSVPNLSIMTSGKDTDSPAELLSGPRLAKVIDTLRERYETIWIDSPPLIPVADARDVAPLADLLLVVVRSGRTRQQGLMRAAELLHLREGQVALAVLNDISGSVDRQYGYSRYQYDGASPAERENGAPDGSAQPSGDA